MQPVFRDRRAGGKRLHAIAVIAVCGFLGACPAKADFTLQYTGRPFVLGLCASSAGVTCLGSGSWIQASLSFTGLIPASYTGSLLSIPGVAFTSGTVAVNGFAIRTGSVFPNNPGIQIQFGAPAAWSVFFGDQNGFTNTNGEIAGSMQSTGGDYVNFVTGNTFYNGVTAILGTWTVVTPLQVATSSLPNATAGQPYSQTLNATGGSGAGYTWSVASGTLPAGYSLSAGGMLASTGSAAAAAQSYAFTVRIADSAGNSATQALALMMQPALQIATSALPNAVSGQPYSAMAAAAGGSGTYIWSVASGSLPPGFTLSSAGVLSSTGTPPAAPKSYAITVAAADTSNNSATQALTLVVDAPLQIATASLPTAFSGKTYNAVLTAAGASGIGYAWPVTAGSLPAGFTLSGGGVLASTGSPAAPAQSYPFTVQVADSLNATAAQAFTLLVQAPVQIATTALPDATAGQAYAGTLTAAGGSGSGYVWTVAGGTLPAGFTLSAAGTLASSGHPAAAPQTYSFIVKAADSSNANNSASLPLTLVVDGPLRIATTTLANTVAGQSYSVTLGATGGSGASYTWGVSGGMLPAGFTLSAAGVLSSTGTPAALASLYGFTVKVTDAAGNNATQALTLLVQAPLPFQIATPTILSAVPGQPCNTAFAATGGSGGGYTWSLSSGLLPTGFTLSASGTLASTGNPVPSGQSYTFTLKVVDSAGNTAVKQFTLIFLPPLQVVTAAVPNYLMGQAYNAVLTATGGTGSGYSWSIQNGYMPAGFTLTATGTIGAPANAGPVTGSYSFVVQVTDSGGSTATQTFTINVPMPLQIVPGTISGAALPNATSGQPYSYALTASGGTGTGFTWSISSGALPAGFTVTGGTIASSGSAAVATTYNFTVKVADSAGNTATMAFTLMVQPALTIVTSILPGAVNGQPYSAALTATGGSGYTWSIAGGALPAGFSLSADGTLSSMGSPAALSGALSATAAQSFGFTVSVTAPAFVNAATKQLSLTVNPSSTGLPAIAPGGVVPLFSSSTTIQAGSWASIYGSNLAGGPVVWNGDFPTSLGGVGVTVNSKPAYLWSVSPAQINFQAPADTATGTVNVVVTTTGGTAAATVNLGEYSPSFSMLNGTYPAAIVPTPGKPGTSGAGYDAIGPPGVFSFPTRPVKAGETVVLYGVGFGPTKPAVAAGKPFTGAAPCLNAPLVTIGGVAAKVAFAGIVETGLYQINVVVPSAGSGDQPVLATIGGLTTPGNVAITLQ